MKDLTIGVHLSAASVKSIMENIAHAEQSGVDVAWLTCGGPAPDPLAIFAAAAMSCQRIDFGTCIIPTFPRHPIAMAQGALVVDQLAPGRLRLGIGPSHEPAIRATYEIPFERPLQHLREYVTILNALLKEGKVDFSGKRLSAHTQIAGPTGVKIMISALRPNAWTLAGEMTDGGISWVSPLPYMKSVARPSIETGAKKAGKVAPAVIAHVPVVVSDDAEAVLAASMRQLGFYPRLPYYSAMWQDAGFPEAKEGTYSERMSEALVISGNAETVSRRIREIKSYGVDEIIAMPLQVPEDNTAFRRTVELLGTLARQS
jgi:F420-dependent oxidoreductase-like protein